MYRDVIALKELEALLERWVEELPPESRVRESFTEALSGVQRCRDKTVRVIGLRRVS